jgi:CRP/FNR family transcriptional regulator, cyclic AMP receptor protein
MASDIVMTQHPRSTHTPCYVLAAGEGGARDRPTTMSAMPARTVPADIPALIAALPPPLARLAESGAVRAYRKGTLLMEEGDEGDTLYIILSGRLRAFSLSATRDREVTYGSYGPGEYVGEMGLDGGPRSASVIATELSLCAAVTRRTLEAHIGEHPEFAFQLLAKVIRRARAATLTARQMVLNDVYGRLKALFETLAVRRPDGTLAIDERLTHKDIAGRVGCSREMVTRVMKDLVLGGYVDDVSPPLRVVKGLPERW